MNKDWNTDEIIEEFTLLPSELEFLGNRPKTSEAATKCHIAGPNLVKLSGSAT